MTRWVRRGAGIAVIGLCLVPIFRLIRVERSGPWGAETVRLASNAHELTLWGSLVVLGLGLIAGMWVRRQQSTRAPGEGAEPDGSPGWQRTWLRTLVTPSSAGFFVGVGALATMLSATITTLLYRRLLTNVDEMTAVIHARYLAAGQWGGPVGDLAESWLLPNMLLVDEGWVSQYPIGHLALLGLGERLGAAWLVGPVLLGLMVGFSAAAFDRLLGEERRLEGRVAALLLALSPFVLLMGAGALSHVSAGAAGAAAAYFALRARSGSAAWALTAGAAMGVMVLSRPWTGLTLGTALTLGVWWLGEESRSGGGWVRRVALWVVGGAPFALAFAWVNRRLFGSATRLGYEVLYGPSHRLGLHTDPWGFDYGLREALAYTSADLTQFGAGLLDAPLTVPVVAGAALALLPRLGRAGRIAALWALVPLAANALYWFHQPRMLFESAPGWTLLAVLGVAAVLRAAPRPYRVGALVAVGSALALAAVVFVPGRFSGSEWSPETLARIQIPDLPNVGLVNVADLPENARALGGAAAEDRAPLVFVHASWNERVAARLQAAGVRGDSLQSLLRRNDHCALDRWARVARGLPVEAEGAELEATLDRTHTGAPRPDLEQVRLPGGVQVGRVSGTQWPPECARQIQADRFGAVSLAPLLWQGDLPGLEEGQPMFARDYGPEWNARVMERFPERTPWLFTPTEVDGPPQIVDYAEGMRVLWGG